MPSEATTPQALNFIATPPYPPRSGGELRAWHLYRHLSPVTHQTILCRSVQPLTPEQRAAFDAYGIEIRDVPIPRPGPGTKLIKGMRFACSRFPLRAAGWSFWPMRKHLRDLLASRRFDFIVMETSWLCTYWPLLERTRALKVLDLYDVVSDLLEREAAIMRRGWERFHTRLDARRMRCIEAELVQSCHLTLVPSAKDQQAILRRVPGANVAVVPNGIDCAATPPLPPAHNRELLFVGSLNYYPNVDGVTFFINDVLPRVRRRYPETIFRVVGRHPPASIARHHGRDGVCIEGEVKELEPYYRRAAACVVPLRAGGGTRLKVLEAMAYARPVVTTALGCEGIDATPNVHLLIAETPDEFCEAIGNLFQQPERAGTLVERARALAQSRYDWKQIAQHLYETYVQLMETSRR